MTIVNRFGQERTGRATIFNRQQGAWVLNMGGPHGTPGIATRDNVTRVKSGGKGKQAKRRQSNPVVRVRKRAVVLRRNGKGRTVRASNPAIGVLGNPPDAKYLGKVTYMEYIHGHDGQPYYHHFKPAVYAQVTNDGRVMLWHPTNNLWKLFPVPK